MSIDRVDASGLPVGRTAEDILVEGGEHRTRSCDGAVVEFRFDGTDAAVLRAASRTIVI